MIVSSHLRNNQIVQTSAAPNQFRRNDGVAVGIRFEIAIHGRDASFARLGFCHLPAQQRPQTFQKNDIDDHFGNNKGDTDGDGLFPAAQGWTDTVSSMTCRS